MGRQTDFDGVIYCDWRINIRNCVDEEFFFGVQAFSTVTFFLTVIIMAFLIFFRAVILKESFRQGSNLSIVGVFVSSIFFTLSGILLFFGNSTIATGVCWALAFPLGLLPHINIAYSLTMALPGYLSPGDQVYIKYIPPPNIFGKIVITFGIQLTIIFVVLLGLSEYWNTTGNFELSNTLFIVALAYFSFNLTIFLPYHLYCSILFLKIGSEKLELVGKNFEDSEPVRIALFKARQSIRGIFTTGILVLIPFLSLAIDNNVFRHIPLSRACCFLVAITSLLLLVMNFIYLGTDIKKNLFNIKKKKSSQNHSSASASSLKARSHSKPNSGEPQLEVESRDSPVEV